MKKLLFLCMLGMVMATPSNAQFAFNVNPGFNYNGANFGFKTGNFMPYMGVNYFGGSGKVTYTQTEFNYDTMLMEEVTDEYKFKANVILPTLGCRFYFLNRGDLKAFANVNVTKPIVTAKFVDNGVEDTDISDYVKKLSIWAGEVGFGAEYHFAPQFSLSGEFGLRWVAASFKDSYDQDVYNPLTGLYETYPATIKAGSFFAPTYSKISLNFYFGKVE